MGNFTSIFRHPEKGVYRYSFGAESLTEERKAAEIMGVIAKEDFGDLLYCRPVRQVLPRCGRLYRFRINKSSMRLHYRVVDEDMYGQFDYFDISGPHNSTINFVIDVIQTGVFETQARGKFDAAMSIKFADFCSLCEFEFVRSEGGIELVAHSFPKSQVRIPLEVGHTHMWL